MSFFRSMLAALAIATAASVAVAQQAGAALAPPAPVPTPSCVKPGEGPGRNAPDNRKRAWMSEATGYLDCLKKFVAEQEMQAMVHAKVARAAVEEHNAAAKDLTEQAQRAQQN